MSNSEYSSSRDSVNYRNWLRPKMLPEMGLSIGATRANLIYF